MDLLQLTTACSCVAKVVPEEEQSTATILRPEKNFPQSNESKIQLLARLLLFCVEWKGPG